MRTAEQTGFPSIDKPWLKFYSEEVLNYTQEDCTIYENLLKSNKDYPNDIAINYLGRKITYRELFENIDKTEAAFLNAGVKENDIVTIALPSIPEVLYCVYALNKIGAVSNMIHPLAGKEETINYINEVKSRIVVIYDGAYDAIKGSVSETTAKKFIVASPGESLQLALKFAYSLKVKKPDLDEKTFISWKSFIKAGKGHVLSNFSKDCHSMAIISHTGGTTGEPKGVMCSDVSCNSLMWQILCNFEFDRQEICMAVLPPFVNYSLVESMMGMLAVGFVVVLIPSYKPEEFAKYVKKYHPNEILSIPSYWEALLRIDGIEKEDFSCLKHLIYGGESMSAEMESEINRLLSVCGAKTELCKGIGATEMVAGATVSYIGCNPPNSVGIPMVKTNCKIVVPGTMDEISYNEEGEICFAGDTLMLGYYNNVAATDEVVKRHEDGNLWLHTGDIGYIDEDGIIYVTGRIKRIIMTKDESGQVTKMFPDRIEKAIYSDKSVKNCCVIGIADDYRINYSKAFVVLKDGIIDSEDAKKSIIKTCKSVLPDYMVPEEVEFRKELPRTERGKVDYRALEQEIIKTFD